MVMENKLRQLPSVDKLLGEPKVKELEKLFPHDLITDLIRENLACYRAAIGKGKEAPALMEIVENIVNQGEALARPTLRPLINATGVVFILIWGGRLSVKNLLRPWTQSPAATTIWNSTWKAATGAHGIRMSNLCFAG